MSSKIAMEGYMMKRRGGAGGAGRGETLLRRIGTKWDKRYFVLLRDGRLGYYKDRPSETNKDGIASGNATLVCANATECDFEPVSKKDVALDPAHNLPNSFHVIHAFTGVKTLLLTNGPEEYQNWMLAFQVVKAAKTDEKLRKATCPIDLPRCWG